MCKIMDEMIVIMEPNEYMGQQKKKGRFFWHVRPMQLMKPC